MTYRDNVEEWKDRLQPLKPVLLPIVIAVALVAFVPARVAAALLGVLAALVLSGSYISRLRPATQSAILWIAITVSADAAYARWNDQAPVTLVNAFYKVVDGIMKLILPLIRSLGLSIADPRNKVVAVAPDFIWALILSLIALRSLSLAFPSRSSRRDSYGSESRLNDRGGMSRPRAVA
jgi:hypothetical protein